MDNKNNPAYTFPRLGIDVRTKAAQIVTTSKEFVDWALTLNTHNRLVRKSVVAFYARQMTSGQWELTGQGIGFTRNGFLSDGQHRLIANRDAGYPPIEIVVTTGLSEMSQAKVDAHAKRTIANAVGLVSNIMLTNWKCATIRLLARCEGLPSKSIAIEDVIALQEKYEEAFSLLSPYPKGAPQSAAFAAATVFMAHLSGDVERIRGFITGVADGIGLNFGDPRLTLRNWLAGRKQYVNGKGTVAQDALFSSTAKCLAAWMARSSFSLIRVGSFADAIELLKDAAKAKQE